MPNNPYLTRYKVTCPECGQVHYTFTKEYCHHCGADFGGRTVESVAEFCNITINALNGDIAVRTEWE